MANPVTGDVIILNHWLLYIIDNPLDLIMNYANDNPYYYGNKHQTFIFQRYYGSTIISE